jgi:uncharacterized membrane protein YfcA
MQDLAFSFAGMFVGLVVGLTGVGGGSLMTPILIFFFGMKPHLAIGTDLLFAAGTKFGGSLQLARAKRIDWPVVSQMALGSVPACLLTLYALEELGATSPEVQRAMTSTLGVALMLTAVATLYKALKGQSKPTEPSPELEPQLAPVADATQPTHPALPILFGAAIGTLVTLTSVGAGAIGVLVLMLVYPHLPLKRIVAADIAHAVPLTLVAGLGHAGLGTVDWWLLAKLLAGSLPGIWLGSHLAHRMPERLVRSLLSLLLAYAGSKLLTI